MSSPLSNVAIIGAGLGGCAVALALSARNVYVTLYEYRSADAELLRSGVLLTPNGLRILDHLGVLARIKHRCWIATHRIVKDDRDEVVRKAMIANEELYGYPNHRVWRKILLDEMRAMLRERGVPIHYNSRLDAILSTSAVDGVTFTLHGAPQPFSASLLIGCDGIRSTVRRILAPDVEPEYTGTVAILTHIPRRAVTWPLGDADDRNATIQGRPGALIYIPEDPAGDDLLIGIQRVHPAFSRADLDALQQDPDRLVGFFLQGYEDWGATARRIIDAVVAHKHSAYAWPYIRIPRMERWWGATEGKGGERVVLMGDAAHAVPPSSGQGVNQALEDAWSLTMLLMAVKDGEKEKEEKGEGGKKVELLEALEFWRSIRQAKIDAIFDWATNQTNVERLPAADRERLIAEGKYTVETEKVDDMGWLYRPRVEEDVAAWLAARA